MKILTLLAALVFATAAHADPRTIDAIVNKDGSVTIEGKKVSGNEVFEACRKLAAESPQPVINIRPQAESNYDAVGKLIYSLMRAGFKKDAVRFVPTGAGKP